VPFNVYGHESYERSIRNWPISASPDVASWYADDRMRQFVEPGLLGDVSAALGDEARARLDKQGLELVAGGVATKSKRHRGRQSRSVGRTRAPGFRPALR
jgi:hypothetical protein